MIQEPSPLPLLLRPPLRALDRASCLLYRERLVPSTRRCRGHRVPPIQLRAGQVEVSSGCPRYHSFHLPVHSLSAAVSRLKANDTHSSQFGLLSCSDHFRSRSTWSYTGWRSCMDSCGWSRWSRRWCRTSSVLGRGPALLLTPSDGRGAG